MPIQISNLEKIRRNGETQVDSQRKNILDSAEKLFLKKGLEDTSMSDIAAEAGITRVSLYRYFPDQPTIIFEIAVRMLKKITLVSDVIEGSEIIVMIKNVILRMIDQFYLLEDAFRYMGMFDHLYGSSYPNERLSAWYKAEIYKMGWGFTLAQIGELGIDAGKIAMISNNTLSFLEKMAARGSLIANEQDVSMDQELFFFKEMVSDYFDKIKINNKEQSGKIT